VAAPFGIQGPTNTVLLGPNRTGEAAFSVSNQTGRAVRARASVVVVDPTQASWLSVGGMAERHYPIGGMEQVTVTVTVPPEAAAGIYQFRLSVASVVNPDEDWAQGPLVAFQVTGPGRPPDEPRPTERPGYLETLVGAYVGGLPLGAIVLLIGWVVESEVIIIIGGIALWIGSVIGAYVALRVRGFPEPRSTAIPLAALFPVASIFIIVGAFISFDFLVQLITAVLTVTAAALGARAFARWRATGGL
jgi:hypothetical protein